MEQSFFLFYDFFCYFRSGLSCNFPFMRKETTTNPQRIVYFSEGESYL